MKKFFILIIIFISFNLNANTVYEEEFESIINNYLIEENIPKDLHEDFKGFAYYYYFNKEPSKAIDYGENLLLKSFDYYERDSEDILQIHIYLGELYFYLQNLKKAYEHLNYALPLSEKLYPDNKYNIILGNFTFGKVSGLMGLQDEAISSFKKLITLLDQKKYNDLFNEIFVADEPNIRFIILQSILGSYSIHYNDQEIPKLIEDLNNIEKENEIYDQSLSTYYGNVGNYYTNKYNYLKALEYYSKALNKLDSVTDFNIEYHPTLWSSLAMTYSVLGNYLEAEKLLLKAEKEIINNLGANASGLFQVYHNLGSNYSYQLMANDAIFYFNKAIEIAEYSQGFPEERLLQTLLNLSSMYLDSYKLDEFEKIKNKILNYYDESNEKIFLEDFPRLLITYHIAKGNFDIAREKSISTIKFLKEKYGNNNYALMDVYSSLSLIEYSTLNYTDAIKYSEIILNFQLNDKSSLSIKANQKMTLAEIYFLLWKQEENIDVDSINFKKAKQYSIEAHNFFSENKTLNVNPYLTSVTNLSSIYHNEGKFNLSINMDKEALNIIENNIGFKETSNYTVVSSIENQKQYKGFFNGILGRKLDFAIDETLLKQESDRYSLYEEIFKLTQLINANKTDLSLKKMGFRASASSEELKNIILKKDQQKILIDTLSEEINMFKTQQKEIRNIEEEKKQIKKLNELLVNQDELNAYLYNNYPEFIEVSSNQIMSLDSMFNLLEDDEALLYFVSDFSATLIVLITNNDVIVSRIEFTNDEINKHITKIRDSFDLTDVYSIRDIKPFPIESSQLLYKELIGNTLFEDVLINKKHLFIVPNGIFYSLPFSALIYDKILDDEERNNYSTIPWLINKFSFSVLPSIHSLKIFRSKFILESDTSLETFIGIGNPLFQAKAKIEEKEISFNQIFSKGRLADTTLISQFSQLPETEKEITMIAENFSKKNVQMYFQKEATETMIKNLNFKNTDVIAFSTHAIINGEMNINEPGLILTPPSKASIEDDGILTSSEILSLELDADFVILSACNTASSEDYNSEPLSGLARAFFFAGAKSLLVSNWAVESDSTVKLTTKMFNNMELGQNKSESLQNSMINLLSTSNYNHPLFWAPFMLVGDR